MQKKFKTVGNLTVKNSLQDFDAREMYLHPKNRSVLFKKRRKSSAFIIFESSNDGTMPFQNVPVRVLFSKSNVFEICRQKMCRFRMNGRPIHHIFHRFQNVLASCEGSIKAKRFQTNKFWTKNFRTFLHRTLYIFTETFDN